MRSEEIKKIKEVETNIYIYIYPNQVRQVGSLANQIESTRDNPQARRVYLTDGIAPTLNTAQGGGRTPYIIV